jgi:hypothetical protein
MRSLFTVHAGELLAGEHVERRFRNVNVWVPSRDTGVDLLITDRANRRTVSLQVKFSRDFLVTDMPTQFQKTLRACGWWTLNRKKLVASCADYWVFTLIGFARRSTDYILVPRKELLRRLDSIHRRANRLDVYLWVTEKNRCWATRGLTRQDHERIVDGNFRNATRDFTRFLNNWGPVVRLNSSG